MASCRASRRSIILLVMCTKRPKYLYEHTEIDMTDCRSAFVNSKGFGGNNATGLFLSPIQTEEMLSRRWGKTKWLNLCENEKPLKLICRIRRDCGERDKTHLHVWGGGNRPEDLIISGEEIKLPGLAKPIKLNKIIRRDN